MAMRKMSFSGKYIAKMLSLKKFLVSECDFKLVCFCESCKESKSGDMFRISQKLLPEVFCKKSVLRNFAKFAGKHLRLSFFLIKLQGPATLLKRRLWRRCFSVNFAKFLRTPFLQNTSGRLLLISVFPEKYLNRLVLVCFIFTFF